MYRMLILSELVATGLHIETQVGRNSCKILVTAGNITLGKMHKYYKSLPLELFRALVVGA